MTTDDASNDQITIEQGSYWRSRESIVVPGLVYNCRGEDDDKPITIPAGQVLLLQSIRDVDNTAHTIILRPHPSVYGMSIYTVAEYRDGKPYSWKPGPLKEFRFLVADFLTKFVLEPRADSIRAKELAEAHEHVRQMQLRLTEGQNNPEVMKPVLQLGIQQWEEEKKLDPEQAAYIAEMSTSTALVPTMTGQHVEHLKLRVEREHTLATVRATWIKERVAEVGEAVKALTPYMEEQAAAALSQTEDILRKVSSIQKSIESLDLYIGKDVTVETICIGESAPADVPLTIGQRKLFMGEEFSVWADVDEKFDYDKDCQFLKALAENPSLQQQIFPSDRAVVCMATRRTDKDYGDPWVNSAKNPSNKEVFLLVRDGSNLYRVFSPVESHLRALQLFPSRSETDAIFSGADGNNINFMDTKYTDKLRAHELVALHYKRFLILLAGLDHRLNLFGTFYEGPKTTKFVSLEFQRDHFRFVHDADGEGMLPMLQRPSLSDWLRQNNAYLRSGSRVMCLWENLVNPKTAPGMTKEDSKSNRGYHNNRYPEKPYEVAIVRESAGELVVSCASTCGRWRRNGSSVQQSRVSLTAWKENYYQRGMGYVVLDAIKADELDWYIHDRDSRVSHLEYIAIFKAALAYLRQVEQDEAPVRRALLEALNAGSIGDPSKRLGLVDSAVRSWRADHRGANLPPNATGSHWTDLLNTMYTIANGHDTTRKVEMLAAEMGVNPLRFTVTGANKLALYVEPKPEERDDRVTAHIWVNKLHLDVKKTGEIKVARPQWAVLPTATAAETTIHEWPGAKAWAGLKSPFPSLGDKQDLLAIVNGRGVMDSPWLKEKVSSAEWYSIFDDWRDAYRRKNRTASTVENVLISFPVGVSVHTEKNTFRVISLYDRSPEVRLWALAPDEEHRKVLRAEYGAPYCHRTRATGKLIEVAKNGSKLTFVVTKNRDRFPTDDHEYDTIRLLLPKTHHSSVQDCTTSLDWRFDRGVDYLNMYKARYGIPFTMFTLNPEMKERTLDAVFFNYVGELETPLTPEPKKEATDDGEELEAQQYPVEGETQIHD